MEAVTYSTFRKNLRGYLDKTMEDAETILVTSKNPDANVVVMNAHDYDNLMENLRIHQNQYLMDKLARGKAEVDSGKVTMHELVEDDQ